jgi:outer membrane protein
MSRLVLWAAALGLVTAAALPASSADLKVAVVESEFGPKQRELENRDKELKARFEKYQRDSVAMSEADRDKQEKELRDAQRDLERRAQEFRDDAQSRGRSETQRVQKIIFDEIKAYSKANTFDLVLTGGLQGGVLDYKESLDITTAVLAQLQAKYKPAAQPAAPQPPATQPKPPAKTN